MLHIIFSESWWLKHSKYDGGYQVWPMWQTWQKLDKCDPLGPFRSTPWPPEVEPTNSSCYCRFLSMVFWSLTAFKLRTWAKKSFLHPSCPIHRHIVTFCRSFTDKNALPTEADTCNLVQTQAYDLWRVTMTFITLPTFTFKTTVAPPLHECSFFARYRRRGGPSQPRWRTRPLGLACGNTNLWNDLTY